MENPPFVLRHIGTILVASMCAIDSLIISCSDEATIKHSSVEPDAMPMHDTILFRSGDEQSFGYYTEGTDTAFAKSCAWYVELDGKRYACSKRVYELLDMYYTTERTRFEFCGHINKNDSIELSYAAQCLRNI